MVLFGTAHDDLNGHGPGLGYLGPDPNYVRQHPRDNNPPVLDIPLSCGIDPNGNPWIMFNNQYFSSISAIKNYLAIASTSGTVPFDATNAGAQAGYLMLQQSVSNTQIPNASNTDVFNPDGTLAGAVGALKFLGVPFTAYQPAPAPTITPTQTIATSATPTATAKVAPDPQTLLNYATAGTLMPSLFSWPSSSYNAVLLIHHKWSTNYFLQLFQKWSPGGSWYAWDGSGWEPEPQYNDVDNPRTQAGVTPEILINMYFPPGYAAPVAPTPGTLNIPSGYQVMPAAAPIRAWPIYSQVPTFHADGTTSIGGPAFYGFTVPDRLMGGQMSSQYIGLDKTKLSAGLYAYKETDLGPIISAAGRTYQLYMFTIFDLYEQKIIGPFFETVEGGGGGLLISNPLLLASRIIVDLSTLGNAELIRAGAQAAGVSQANIDLATQAGAALAIALATAGVASALTAAPTTIETATGAAFPVAADAGSATASLILPTTAEVAAMDAAGATLLPASLSLIAPATASLTVAEAVTAGAAATVPEAAAVPSSIAVPAGVKATAASLTKAVEGAVISTGATALSTEIKKLTGQLPGAKPPSQLVYTQTALPPSDTATPSKILTWGLGALAALAILKKKIS